MHKVFPIISILAGIFFILIPFVGSSTDTEGSHNTAAGAISFAMGALFVIVGGYYLVKGGGTKKQ